MKNSALATGAVSLLLFSVLLPKVRIGSTEVGLDDFAAVLLLMVLAKLAYRTPKPVVRGVSPLVLWLILVVYGMVFSLLNNWFYMGELLLPTHMWQYVKRAVYFGLPFYFGYRQTLPARRLYDLLLWFLLIACAIGVLQSIPTLNIGDSLVALYARSDQQFYLTAERLFSNKQVIGIAGFATAWGGFAMFALAFAFAAIAIGFRGGAKSIWGLHKREILLVFLAGFNLMMAGSRVALAAALVVVVSGASLLFLQGGKPRQKRRAIALVLGLGVLIGVATTFFPERASFLTDRFDALVHADRIGAARGAQVEAALGLLRDVSAWLLGVGHTAQKRFAVSWGTEIEMIYLLVSYGVLGLVLHYLLLWISAYHGLGVMRRDDPYAAVLGYCAVLAVIGYVVFSLGYFFFRELKVGAFPWILFGWVAGYNYRCLSIWERSSGALEYWRRR